MLVSYKRFKLNTEIRKQNEETKYILNSCLPIRSGGSRKRALMKHFPTRSCHYRKPVAQYSVSRSKAAESGMNLAFHFLDIELNLFLSLQ